MNDNEKMFEDIWKDQKILIGNPNIKNHKQLILIAGVPGSGKTTLLRALREKVEAIYIRSDDIRDIINKTHSDNVLANNPSLKEHYLEYIFNHYIPEFENQTIILDMSMDREYNFLLQLAEKYGYPRIIISLNCTENTLVGRLEKRESLYVGEFLKNIPKWIADHDNFNKLGIADIVFNTEEKDLTEMVEEILRKLRL